MFIVGVTSLKDKTLHFARLMSRDLNYTLNFYIKCYNHIKYTYLHVLRAEHIGILILELREA